MWEINQHLRDVADANFKLNLQKNHEGRINRAYIFLFRDSDPEANRYDIIAG